MDGPGTLLTRLRHALSAFDDDALAALSSKGLVRRAGRTWRRSGRGSSNRSPRRLVFPSTWAMRWPS